MKKSVLVLLSLVFCFAVVAMCGCTKDELNSYKQQLDALQKQYDELQRDYDDFKSGFTDLSKLKVGDKIPVYPSGNFDYRYKPDDQQSIHVDKLEAEVVEILYTSNSFSGLYAPYNIKFTVSGQTNYEDRSEIRCTIQNASTAYDIRCEIGDNGSFSGEAVYDISSPKGLTHFAFRGF